MGWLHRLCSVLVGGWLLASGVGVCADERSAQADEHFARGQQAYQAGEYERARQEFNQALQLLTGDVGAASVPAQLPEPVARVASASPTEDAMRSTTAPAVVEAPYLIGVRDVLGISVWQVADLTRDVTVRPDGKISYPLIGDLPAEGLTLTELDRLLTDRLRLYVRDPQVSVELKTMGQQLRLIVLGEVNRQGVFPLPGRTITIPEAIALGEGFKRIGAKIKDVVVIKGYPQQPQLFHVDVKTLLIKGEDPQRLLVGSGDIVFVSRSWIGNMHAFIDAASPMLNAIFQGVSAYTLYSTLNP